MILYAFITLLLLLGSFWEVCGGMSKNKNLYYFLICSFIFWCISFLRWSVGTDWDSYYSIFENCNDDSHYEWGFITLNRIVKNTVNNYSCLLALLGSILFYYQTKTIKELSFLPITTLFILWGTNLGNIFFVRQSIAVTLLLYSIVQIEKRNVKGFLLIVFGATLIHASSISFLPAYWIYHHRFTLIQVVLAFSLSMVLGSVGGTYLWGNLGKLLGGIYAAKIEGYMASGADAAYNEGMSAADLYIRSIGGKLVLIFMFSLLIAKEFEEEARGLINLFLFASIMLPITFSVSPTLNRMWTPYFQIQIYLMTFVLASMKRIPYKLIAFSILIVMTLVRLYLKLFIDYDGEAFLPFQTIFSI
ncbi:MAG: EpsG family protein [Bacteroides sp.]|nr:EpsG family protein [Bacteroides sp.]